jgi:hypothetical protein
MNEETLSNNNLSNGDSDRIGFDDHVEDSNVFS